MNYTDSDPPTDARRLRESRHPCQTPRVDEPNRVTAWLWLAFWIIIGAGVTLWLLQACAAAPVAEAPVERHVIVVPESVAAQFMRETP